MVFGEPFDIAQQQPDGNYGPTYEEWQAYLEQEQLAKELLKESAIAKLLKLGLTEEEAKAVIGIG